MNKGENPRFSNVKNISFFTLTSNLEQKLTLFAWNNFTLTKIFILAVTILERNKRHCVLGCKRLTYLQDFQKTL